jgi:two-component system NtrC family sensor kinase
MTEAQGSAVVQAQAFCYVRTVPDRCRLCFTCVRECPSKAIRIFEGQARVIPERCIGCGNCVQVCSQGAKEVVSTISEVEVLLAGPDRVAACIAPSFPAEFPEHDFRELVGMIRTLGFDMVTEVGFGADLVAERYRRLYASEDGRQHIATSCPAAVGFVERYHPDLVPRLAPIVSPMVAMARALRFLHGSDLKVVFVGPCIAKKVESRDGNVEGEINAVLTFVELQRMLADRGIAPSGCEACDFDEPRPSLGSLFSLDGGLLQAAGVAEDLLANAVVSAYGRSRVGTALDDFECGTIDSTVLEVLFCTACVMGPGMTSTEPQYRRRARVSHYVRYRQAELDRPEWRRQMARLAGLDLTRAYTAKNQLIPAPSDVDVEATLRRMGKAGPSDELNCGACGYPTCREHAGAILAGLAESEMCLPYTISRLQETVRELSQSHEKLRSTQEQLMHTERLASMGQLAAGVAHELNNPLGVVLMYSHLLKDEVANDSALASDLALIASQADRCKRIVSDLLDFARENKVLLQDVVVDDFVDRALASVPLPQGITSTVTRGHAHPHCEMDPEQMMQVLTNLVSNACAAMETGGGGRLTIETRDDDEHLTITVGDTGHGIAPDHMAKIFQPFFTTKQIGKGTGLGLAVSYGIVKMHRGAITVASNTDPAVGPTGTRFMVTIPRNARGERVA